MQCYVGGRCSGKTTRLIELSHDTGIPILVHTLSRGRQIELQAHDMGKPIPSPQCLGSMAVTAGALRGERVLIDELGALVEHAFDVRIVAASIDGEALTCANPALADMGLIEAARRWWGARRRGASDEKGCAE